MPASRGGCVAFPRAGVARSPPTLADHLPRAVQAFPSESEFVYPPMTMLRYTGKRQKLKVDEITYTVLEIEPTMGGG